METLVNTTSIVHAKQVEKTETKKSTPPLFWELVEFNRFGIIPMLLVIVACVGGAAASFGANGDALRLSLVAFGSMFSLSMVLAVAPMRWVLYSALIALIIDGLVLVV